MCANDLQNDNNLHEIAQKRAHDDANGKVVQLSDDISQNRYEIDTGDPSKITGKIYLFNLLIFYIISSRNDRQGLV